MKKLNQEGLLSSNSLPAPLAQESEKSELGHRCPSCGAAVATRYEFDTDIPAHVGVLWPSANAARSCKRGNVTLAECEKCGLIFNCKFDLSSLDYAGHEYDNSLHHSAVFGAYSEPLARELIDRYDLCGRTVLEIGCGNGAFLRQLCDLGAAKGIGFDPACDPSDVLDDDRIQLTAGYYASDGKLVSGELVACRQVLEHLADPRELLCTIQRGLQVRNNAVVFIEVPNADAMLERNAVWDVIYEHHLYFSADSLKTILHACGFGVLRVRELFDRQFLAIEASVASEDDANDRHGPVEAKNGRLERFAEQHAALSEAWRKRLRDMRSNNLHAAVWGAGARAVSFLNAVDPDASEIRSVFDINPRKDGCFVAGTGHEIYSANSVGNLQPDVVILMNPVYRNEVAALLQGAGVAAEILCA